MFLDIRGAASTRVQQPYAGPDQLLKILIAGHHDDIHSRFDAPCNECPDYIVGFISREGQDWNSVGIEHLTYALHTTIEVGLELFRELFSRGLVGWIALMPKRETRVMHPAEIIRLMLGDESL